MKLTVIGSSSKGNAYALIGESETLLLEAGVPFSQVRRSLNYDTVPVVGCCISHRHGDHASHAKEYQCPIFGNKECSVCCDDITILTEGKTREIGSFSVTPFHVKHDVENFGYLIRHPEMGSLLFATDTDTLPYQFEGVNHWLIEANYSDKILHDALYEGRIDRRQCERIMVSHMSVENCIRNLKESHAENADTITLIHLSSRHSNPKQFADTVAGAFGVPTQVASKGISVNLNKEII
jgi:ribonuclease BN (tRNA processing enzyme)